LSEATTKDSRILSKATKKENIKVIKNMKKKIFALLALATMTLTASAYDLTVGTNEHGSLTFKVGEETVTTANEGDVVSVVVKAGKGYMSDGVTARAYTSFGGMKAPRRALGAIDIVDNVTVEPTAVDTVYSFTMPAYDVQVNASYTHRALTNDMIHAIADQTWTGSAVTPTLVVTDREYTLTEGTDYTVAYENNTEMGVNTATAIITAKTEGNDDYYIGEASANFSIRKTIAGLTAYAVSSEEHPIIYTGNPQEPEVVVRDVRTTLVRDVDYTVAYSNNVNAGQGQFTVTGIGKYQGELTAYFLINTRDLSSEMISPVTGITYTGSPQYPSLVITYNGKTLVEGKDDGSNQSTCDYYTTYENNTETGEARVKIEGVNNFSGTFYYTFNIDAKELTEDMIGAIADLTYTGNALEPAPTVTYNGMTLNAGTDYTVSYEDNTNAGLATLTISATAQNNNYTGSAQKTFNILKAEATVTAPTVKSGLVYTGEAQPLLNAGLVEGGEMQYSLDGVDYTSTVSTGLNAGEYTVYYKTVGDQNHNDVAAQTLTVSIAKATLTTMTLAQNNFTYNKEEQTAQVATVSAGTIAVTAADYDVTGNAQTNVGTYTATVTAKAASTNFTGSVTAQYSIVPADANIFTMTLDPESFVFNGEAQQPAVTVQDGSAVLTEGTDYDLTFESNVNAGTAKVTATGKGNYVNTQEATFTIQKANAQLGTAPAALTLTYNREAQALVSAGTITAVGTTDESKLQYSIDGVNFSDEIPTATEAGAYTVSYFVLGDANHNNTDTLTVACAIQKDQGTMAFTEANYDLTYGDLNFTNAIIQHGDNDIRFVSSDPRVAEVQYYTGEVTIKGVGQCTITAMMQEHKNFKKQVDNITFTVNVAAREVTADNVTVGEQGENGVPEITVSVEAPVGTLTPAETTDYQLAYYDNPEDRNAVTVEQMLAAPGEYVAVLTFFGNYAGYVEKTITVGSAEGPIPGDVNAGGDVQLDDADEFIDNLLNGNLPTDPESDDFIRHDANQDGRIDIADAQAILNLAMGLNADGTAKNAAPARRNAPAAETESVKMSIEREDMGDGIVRYALNVEGDFAFTGFQADVKTSGRIVTVALANSEMRMRSGILSSGTHRILGLPGTTEQQADGAIAYVFVQGGAATFENVVLTTAQARSIAAVGQTTGVNEVIEVNGVNDNSVYDLSGRKVNAAQKGIVIIGGKKVLNK
jgi:methionine-rich copper-binding protein CopC